MFLTKHPNRIWYLYFRDHNGKRRRISTKCRLKPDALRFLQSFKVEEHDQTPAKSFHNLIHGRLPCQFPLSEKREQSIPHSRQIEVRGLKLGIVGALSGIVSEHS
jgi:hypothetical protein